ncbi:MAG: ATP-binding protein [Prevotella sp.]
MRYLQRNIDQELLSWSKDKYMKPLLLRGARQVGKTSAVRHLAENFEYYVEIDLNTRRDLHPLFESGFSSQQICQQISLIVGIPIIEGRTLLFFDEIQSCPSAINSLRYFYEQMPHLHLIAAGSLLEFALRELPSFGVGRVRSLFMYSFCFNEFLNALGREELIAAIDKSSPDHPLFDVVHKKILEYFRIFLIIGGMPECVLQYVETQDALICQRTLTELLVSYEDDFKKYHAQIPEGLLRDVLRSVAKQGQGKFVYSQVETICRTPQIKEALDMLQMAGLVYSVVHTSGNGIPLYAEANEKYKRYIIMDTGLLQRILGLNLQDILMSDDLKMVNRGALAETFVGCELVKTSSPYATDPLFCWHREKKDSNAEVDFVTAMDGVVVPIEVKSGTKGTMQSMRIFLQLKNLDFGIRTSLENFGKLNDTLIVPLYAIGNYLRRGNNLI